MNSLGDRIKGYEAVSRQMLVKRMPVVIRLDGKAFHTFTKNMSKPFDSILRSAMIRSAMTLMENIQGAKLAYIQSDEVTIVITDYDDINTQGWFNYNHSKIVSISAAMMSVSFCKSMSDYYQKTVNEVFDSRAFNVPSNDITNSLLWRAKDWQRNSLQMYARSFFTHNEMHNKNTEDIHNMLHSIGKNWTTDLLPIEKNGTFIAKEKGNFRYYYDILPNYESINNLVKDEIACN